MQSRFRDCKYTLHLWNEVLWKSRYLCMYAIEVQVSKFSDTVTLLERFQFLALRVHLPAAFRVSPCNVCFFFKGERFLPMYGRETWSSVIYKNPNFYISANIFLFSKYILSWILLTCLHLSSHRSKFKFSPKNYEYNNPDFYAQHDRNYRNNGRLGTESLLDKGKFNIGEFGSFAIRREAGMVFIELNNQNLSTISPRKLIFPAVGINHAELLRTVLLAHTLYYLVHDVSSSTSDEEEKISPRAHVQRTKEK